ncbi:regulatory protein, luxR family [Cyclobacterium lianum]|uniref:Regulatory protein, luxR family n=2 Tax=Cyclobacterium lianum TaxID=388280 RepID=A0A1M7M298_9BACT|nr:regulatory protein, luxR family [Cyclobacterium lianum]
MVSIFDTGRKKFLFHNDTFKSILGYNTDEMTNGGWEFWFKKIKPVELKSISNLIDSLTGTSEALPPMHSGQAYTYHVQDIFRNWLLIQHQVSLLMKANKEFIISYIYNITNQERLDTILTEFQFCYQNNTVEISRREKEVLHLLGEGFSSKQIADKLFISIHTAISHRKHLIEKFAVKNTAQLIKEASKSDLI